MQNFLVFFLLIVAVNGISITSLDDVFIFSSNTVSSSNGYENLFNVTANGQINQNDQNGHFQYTVQWTINGISWQGVTDCLSVISNADELKSKISSSVTIGSVSGTAVSYSTIGNAFHLALKRYDNTTSAYESVLFKLNLNASNLADMSAISISASTASCLSPQCYRDWSNPKSWTQSTVPLAGDDVTLTTNAGVYYLNNDVTVRTLIMNGGIIVGHKTKCPPGWSFDVSGTKTNKCYRLFDNATSFAEADRTCTLMGLSTIDSHLVSIRSRNELNVVKRLCRGSKYSSAYNSGCWIGFKDAYSTDHFTWMERIPSPFANYNNTFVDWRRYGGMPSDNFTQTDGAFNVQGSRCVALAPMLQEDPLSLEQGSYIRSGCDANRAFVCQIFSQTQKYSVTVTTRAEFYLSSTLIGGLYNFLGSVNKLISVLATQSVGLSFSKTSSGIVFGTIILEDGSQLVVDTASVALLNAGMTNAVSPHLSPVLMRSFICNKLSIAGVRGIDFDSMCNSGNIADFLSPVSVSSRSIPIDSSITMYRGFDIDAFQNASVNDVYIGERSSYSGLLPTIVFGNSNVRMAGGSPVRVGTLSAQVLVTGGRVNVDPNVRLSLTRGADVATTLVNVSSSTSTLEVSGYAGRLSTFDAFELSISNRGPVIGSYNYFTDVEDTVQGVYRISVTDPVSNTVQVTSCIPYHASETDVKGYLDALTVVRNKTVTGASVRRFGNGSLPEYGFGYTYRIEFDSPYTSKVFPTGSSSSGSVQLKIHCIGIFDNQCGCSSPKVPLIDPTSGTSACPDIYNVSRTDPNSCVIPASVSVIQLSHLSYMKSIGSGSINMNGGTHRLPAVMSTSVGITDGSGLITADIVTWSSLNSRGTGRLIVSGTGWHGWDSIVDIYFSPLWELHRRDTWLSTAPQFLMTATNSFISELGAVLSASPNSNFTWTNFVWNGGIFGGDNTLIVTNRLSAAGTQKSLRYGSRLIITSSAVLSWRAGNISLSNGAYITMQGYMNISNIDSTQKMFIGQSDIMGSASPNGQLLLAVEPGRDASNYYDNRMDPTYSTVWYQNPICFGDCLLDSYINIEGTGVVNAVSHANVSFYLPLNLIHQSQLGLGVSVDFELANGGQCGNQVVVNIGNNTQFTLSGGNVQMQANCRLQGAGELLVVGGVHDVGLVVDAHITIRSGTLGWPSSRASGITLAFHGGLLIEGEGVLEIGPSSTTVVVDQDVILRDNSQVIFPAVGIAALPSVYDRSDAPDLSPSGSLISTTRMQWDSGSISGKVQVIAQKLLFLTGGDKYVRFLAKLVNKGHCEWSSGNVITEYDGAFDNIGELQMAVNTTFVDDRYTNDFRATNEFPGTIVPVDQGGDPFAQSYFNWDPDYSHLGYDEYVQLQITKKANV